MQTHTHTVPVPYTQTPEQLILALVRAGWTQEQIAGAANISQASVCRLYSGKRADPRYSVVEKLRRLVLSLDEFQAAQ